jgi:hypothetical protein
MSLFKQFLGLRKLSRRSPLTLTLYQPGVLDVRAQLTLIC